MRIRKTMMGAVLALVLLPLPFAQAESELKYDIHELPAVPSEKAATSLIYTVKKFGDRYFATGHQGHIIYSEDGGDTWTQAQVPVRSSLLDIAFPTPEKGWAVGHEGVILHTEDGGKTWVKQYDGLRYGKEGLAYYQKLAEENPDNEAFPHYVGEMEFAIGQGADKPFFRVECLSEKQCYALGAYGMLVLTEDGGETWEPRLHTVENDSFYHVFDFSPLPGDGRFFLAGEAGLFMVADVSNPDKEQRYAKKIHSIPWEGSFFTSTDTADGAIVMGGLRGRMFRTADVGDTWVVVEKPPTSAIVDSIRLADGRLVAVGVAGEVLVSRDNGFSYTRADVGEVGRANAVAEGPGNTLLLGSPYGIKKVTLPQ